MDSSGKTTSLIIYMPALNEAETIQQVIAGLPAHIDGIGHIEVLVVDDGSTDDTATLARQLDATVISHHTNLGLGIAFQTAMDYMIQTNADLLVSIDADGQFDSSKIPQLLHPILAGKAQMVTGNRFAHAKPNDMPLIKYWGNQLISGMLSRIATLKFQDVSCGFRAYSREAVLQLNLFGSFSYTHEVILNLAFKGIPITEVPIQVTYYPERKSRVASNVFRYAYRASKIILRTMLDYRPLYFFGNLGFFSLLVAVFFVGFMLVHYFATGAFTPYKSFGFIGLGFAVAGFFVLFMGLVADMLNRIRLNQDRILYQLKANQAESKKGNPNLNDEDA